MESAIISKINELKNVIPEDDFLNFILDAKIEIEKDNYNKDHSISKREYMYAEKGLMRICMTLENEEISNNQTIIRIEKILNKRDCDNCKYSKHVIKDESYSNFGIIHLDYYINSDCKFCDSCCYRHDLLTDKETEITKEIRSRYRCNITSDLIKTKAILTKINKKLKSL